MEKNSDFILFPNNRRKKIELTNCKYCNCLLDNNTWSSSCKKNRRYICKICWTKRQNKYAESAKNRDPEYDNKKKERTKKWIESFSEERKIIEARKKYKRWLKKAYNLSIEDYDKKLFIQENKCAICKIDRPKNIFFNVDHNHNTGQIRGILCPACNFLLGNCKDNIEILEKAKNYLILYEKINSPFIREEHPDNDR